MVPALGLLFHKEAQTAQIPATVHRAVTEALAHAAGTAAENSVSAAAKFVAKKWIIAAVAALCVGVSVVLLLWQGKKGQNTMPEDSAAVTTAHQPSATLVPEEELVDKTELFAAYKKLYENIQAERLWPDGSSLAISGDLGESLKYALQDFDGDGNEELLISVVTADYMAAYKESMFKYNPASKECVEVASVYPLPIYYDNGTIYGTAANGRRSRSILSFNKESGVYEEIADTKLIYRSEMEILGLTFPEVADKDGDDLVWLIYDGDREADGADVWNQYDGDKQTYMDNEEGEAWIQEKIVNGKAIEVEYIPFSEGWKY